MPWVEAGRCPGCLHPIMVRVDHLTLPGGEAVQAHTEHFCHTPREVADRRRAALTELGEK